MRRLPQLPRALSLAPFGAIVCVAVLVLGRPARARADGSIADAFTLGAAAMLSYFPSETGFDLSSRGAGPRFRLGWSFQVKACWLVHHECEGERLERLRIVLTPRLALGAQTSRDGHHKTATFDLRVGLRYRASHDDHVRVPYFGLGSTVETWPYVRGSLSAEVGVHFGRSHEPSFGWMFGVQADAFVSGDPVMRVMALLGWTVV